MTYTLNKVYQGFYKDSVALMRLSRELKEMEGVNEAALMMGSPSNKQILANAGLLTDSGNIGTGGDLILSIQAVDESTADAVLAAAELNFQRQEKVSYSENSWKPKTIRAAVREEPDANFALISVPGEFAAGEARRALNHGLNVMIFSDNVSIEEELELKKLALEKGLLMMGPDCGTAILDGIPIAFANKVNRGSIGIVGASGTGIQEITSLISNNGGGISHAIGVGGRDLNNEIGGLTTLASIDHLDKDEATKHIVLISKPPGEKILTKILKRVSQSKKPFTICFLGTTGLDLPSNAHTANTLEQTAQIALGRDKIKNSGKVKAKVNREGKEIRGLYSGGTLAAETQIIFLESGQEVSSNVPVPGAQTLSENNNVHKIIDLGDDFYTQGRPHPMIDPEIRKEFLLQAYDDKNVSIIIVDLVIGFGAHSDPAGSLANILKNLISNAPPIIIASVTGTEHDPQVRSKQIKTLQAAGVFVAESNADAARIALQLTGIKN